MNLYSLESVSKYLQASQSATALSAEPTRTLPSKGNFLANPISEFEQRKKQFDEEYHSYMKRPDYTSKPAVRKHPDANLYLTPPARDFNDDACFTRSLDLRGPTTVKTEWQGQVKPKLGGLRELAGERPRQEDSNIFSRQPQLERSKGNYSAQSSLAKLPHSLQPPEEYFPFGRPRAGAPNRPVAERPQLTYAAKSMLGTRQAQGNPTPVQVNYLAQERQAKERQREEMKRALEEQIEMKKARQEQIRRQQLAEDRREEERIGRELQEIDSRIRREIMQGEMSKTIEDPPHPVASVMPLKPEKPVARAEEPVKTMGMKRYASTNSLQRQTGVYRLQTEADKQSSSIKDMIENMKEKARRSKEYSTQGVMELERIKESLQLKSPHDTKYLSQKTNEPYTALQPDKRWYASDSKFVPVYRADGFKSSEPSYKTFGGWGISRPVLIQSDYAGVESAEAKLQLTKLDELLKTTMKEPPFVDNEFERDERSSVASYTPSRQSSQLSSKTRRFTEDSVDQCVKEETDEAEADSAEGTN
jgi:hypothetical protein